MAALSTGRPLPGCQFSPLSAVQVGESTLMPAGPRATRVLCSRVERLLRKSLVSPGTLLLHKGLASTLLLLLLPRVILLL